MNMNQQPPYFQPPPPPYSYQPQCQPNYPLPNIQPWTGPVPNTQHTPSPSQPPSPLPPLPSSHDELRHRLESAGIPPSQIAAVLAQPPPPGPPAAPDKITFRIQPRPYKSYLLTPTNPSLSPSHQQQPTYSASFTKPEALGRRPQLHVYRLLPTGTGDDLAVLVCHCTYHHVSSNKIELEHPWSTPTRTKWEPESQDWGSEVGTLGGKAMRWRYGYGGTVAKKAGEYVIRCAAREGDAEVCRVVLTGKKKRGDREGRIELAGGVFGPAAATERQRDEMVGNAMVQAVRKWKGYGAEAEVDWGMGDRGGDGDGDGDEDEGDDGEEQKEMDGKAVLGMLKLMAALTTGSS